MFPFDLKTIQAIQNNLASTYLYGPDPIEQRWGWAVESFYDTGLIYETKEEAEKDCDEFINNARAITILRKII